MNQPHPSQQPPSRSEEQLSLSRLLNKLGEYRPLGHFVVLATIFSGFWWLAVGHYIVLEQVFGIEGYYPLPAGSLRIMFFTVIGVFLRRLILLFNDVEVQQDDLPVYAVRVMSEVSYSPVLALIIISVSMSNAGIGFTTIIAVVLGIFNHRLVSLIHKNFKQFIG